VNRRITGREFHRFLNPDRDIDEGAERVHGISRAALLTEPRFPEVVDEFLEFIAGAELVIHNADFDVGFLDHELALMKHPKPSIAEHATVLDTLILAREIHPGQRNSLDALCKRYEVDATKRDVHGALIDSELLARVYLAMTGGQTALLLDEEPQAGEAQAADRYQAAARTSEAQSLELAVIRASGDESAAHDALLERLRQSGPCLWDTLDDASGTENTPRSV
ncbi:MAG: DNA polymerase III subunit epsilon, partial [Pseudomonadota bacterium]